MKVLMIGQASKEYGAAITTGAALVAIEMAKQSTKDLRIALYATNIPNVEARNVKDFSAYGYSINPLVYLCYMMRHPINSIRHLYYYKKQMGINPLRFWFYEVNIRRTIKMFTPDIIHVQGITQYMSSYFASDRNVPLVVTLHGYWHTDERGARLFRTAMPYVDNITTLTKLAKRNLLFDYPLNFKHLEIVANGADTSKFFYSDKKRVDIRKHLGFDEETTVFITVASIQDRKGQLKFLQFLHESGLDNYHYLIIGKGDESYVGKLKLYISENSLSDKVTLVGYVDNSEMYCYYSASDIYAHVSTFEGQSLSEMEAASTGLRVLVNEPLVETLPDDVNESNYSYYILNYDDVNFDGFREWARMKTGKRLSMDNYSWMNIVEKYNKVYKSIISNS